MLWNRWDELTGYVREGVRRRFYAVVDAAGLDADRARAWVIVRMMHNAMWELTERSEPDAHWLTTCVAIAKAFRTDRSATSTRRDGCAQALAPPRHPGRVGHRELLEKFGLRSRRHRRDRQAAVGVGHQ